MLCSKIFATIIVLFVLNSCAGQQYSNTLATSENKIAILYNSKDPGSLELINYIFCYEQTSKLNAKFTPYEVQQDGTGLKEKLKELSAANYNVVISLLTGETAKILDQDISKMNITLFSPNKNDFSYKHFISNTNMAVNNQILLETDIAYQSSRSLPLPQNSVNMFKILSLIKAVSDTEHQLNYPAFNKFV
jgi:hypothetical protein